MVTLTLMLTKIQVKYMEFANFLEQPTQKDDLSIEVWG